jgi:hypothetical protein
VNFGIDEFINPRLRAAGISRKAVRKAGVRTKSALGLTPVVRRTTPGGTTSGGRELLEGGNR